jgi:tartrate dehydrogenase/decarboxylase / D-malate dehydrogenase
MMLDHLGHPEAAEEITRAMRAQLAEGNRTRDLGGTAGTAQFTSELLTRL